MGIRTPLEILVKIDAIEKIIKAVKSDPQFNGATIDEAELMPEKTFDFEGVRITRAESSRYDYSEDKQWRELKAKEVEATVKKKGTREGSAIPSWMYEY